MRKIAREGCKKLCDSTHRSPHHHPSVHSCTTLRSHRSPLPSSRVPCAALASSEEASEELLAAASPRALTTVTKSTSCLPPSPPRASSTRSRALRPSLRPSLCDCDCDCCSHKPLLRLLAIGAGAADWTHSMSRLSGSAVQCSAVEGRGVTLGRSRDRLTRGGEELCVRRDQ